MGYFGIYPIIFLPGRQIILKLCSGFSASITSLSAACQSSSSIACRGFADPAHKQTRKRVDVDVTNRFSDARNAPACLAQQLFGFIDPRALQECQRRLPGFCLDSSQQRAGADMKRQCQTRQIVWLLQSIDKPYGQILRKCGQVAHHELRVDKR